MTFSGKQPKQRFWWGEAEIYVISYIKAENLFYEQLD